MSLIEILDSENIKSNLESWIEECQKFRLWYLKLGTQEIDEVSMTKAYLKIEHRIKSKIS
jgi:hypothetical protein